MNRTHRAKIKHSRKNRNIGRAKVLDKKINTKLEKRMVQIAKNEVDRGKKQKLLVRTLAGRVSYPSHQNADNPVTSLYTEAKFVGYPQVFDEDLKHDSIDGSIYRRFLWEFPKIRCVGAETTFNAIEQEHYKRWGANDEILFNDLDEIGNVRHGDTINLTGFKLSGIIYINEHNLTDDIEIDLSVYKCDSEYEMTQAAFQYMNASADESLILPKRLIVDYLGADADGDTLKPDTSGIRSRVFHKHWNINCKNTLKLKSQRDDLADPLIFLEKRIPFSYYVSTDQKIEFARSRTQVDSDAARASNTAINTKLSNQGVRIEAIEFNNVKYIVGIKSNVVKTGGELIAPFINLILTSYFTDIN